LRAALDSRQFISKGAPGAALLPELAAMTKALTLPDAVVAAAGAERLGELGLDSGLCGLLPSFLHMLRELKRAGRSFSVCFRTFGKDLPKLAAEYNALCEGTHPLFPDRDVVLDGSDGKADMRIALPLGATADGCGTFVRDVDGQISLVLGTIEQPPREEATRDGLARFYSAHKGTRVIHGAAAAAAAIEQLVGAGCNHTLALRDYYSGWEATGCQAHGGKPILLHRSPDALQLFFDDHITAHDAHIVDARRAWPRVQRCPRLRPSTSATSATDLRLAPRSRRRGGADGEPAPNRCDAQRAPPQGGARRLDLLARLLSGRHRSGRGAVAQTGRTSRTAPQPSRTLTTCTRGEGAHRMALRSRRTGAPCTARRRTPCALEQPRNPRCEWRKRRWCGLCAARADSRSAPRFQIHRSARRRRRALDLSVSNDALRGRCRVCTRKYWAVRR
jgi:hypothetical protein